MALKPLRRREFSSICLVDAALDRFGKIHRLVNNASTNLIPLRPSALIHGSRKRDRVGPRPGHHIPNETLRGNSIQGLGCV